MFNKLIRVSLIFLILYFVVEFILFFIVVEFGLFMWIYDFIKKKLLYINCES